MTYRIAIAGFQHETNTFMPSRADLAAFEMADSWPPLLQGADVINATQGMNLPIAGAAAAAQDAGVSVVPILWAAAEPSGFVTDDAFDEITSRIENGIAQAGRLDAVYLDLHGAMVTQSHFDGEAALLARLRARFGVDLPIGVSLDLHANISATMAAHADLITIYRTYPHLDMAETGARCMMRLVTLLRQGKPAKALRQVPFLVPPAAQYTGTDPCATLYHLLDVLADGTDEHLEFAMGFSAADVPECGPSVISYAPSQLRAEELAEAMARAVIASEQEFDAALLSPDAAVAQAMAMTGPGPVVLADVQDNPGGGGTGDSTGLLHALVAGNAQNALLGVIADAEVAQAAHRAGLGARIDVSLGAKSGGPSGPPWVGRCQVLALSDGQFAYTGKMYGGGVASVGPSCLLAIGTGLKVVVSSLRTQCLDRAFFTHFGLEPHAAQIVGVKSTVHFRADFEPGSQAVLNVAAPGGLDCDLSAVRYLNLRPGVRRSGRGSF